MATVRVFSGCLICVFVCMLKCAVGKFAAISVFFIVVAFNEQRLFSVFALERQRHF